MRFRLLVKFRWEHPAHGVQPGVNMRLPVMEASDYDELDVFIKKMAGISECSRWQDRDLALESTAPAIRDFYNQLVPGAGGPCGVFDLEILQILPVDD